MQVPKPTRYGEKFYRSRWNNLALILAVGAAMLTYAFLTWPIAVPQGHGDLGPVWGVVAFIAAGTYLYAAWKADMNWRLSRMILLIAGGIHVAFGVLMSLLIGPAGEGLSWLSGLYDVIPGIIAIVAGVLTHAPSGERPTPERVWQQLEERKEAEEHRQRTEGA